VAIVKNCATTNARKHKIPKSKIFTRVTAVAPVEIASDGKKIKKRI
jgi:hypothetical protein